MMKAFIFPGQGAQFSGMGKDIYDANPKAKALFDNADRILGFDISLPLGAIPDFIARAGPALVGSPDGFPHGTPRPRQGAAG